MNDQERRRYFRINETVGLSIQVLDDHGSMPHSSGHPALNAAELVAQDNDRISELLDELADHNPQFGELARLLNRKIERVTRMLAIDNQLLDRIAHRVQEVNISACGLAFSHDKAIPENARIRIELMLYPDKTKVISDGLVVSCEPLGGDPAQYYCRVDFLGMSANAQEELIQFVVQSQSAQLKDRKKEFTQI